MYREKPHHGSPPDVSVIKTLRFSVSPLKLKNKERENEKN